MLLFALILLLHFLLRLLMPGTSLFPVTSLVAARIEMQMVNKMLLDQIETKDNSSEVSQTDGLVYWLVVLIYWENSSQLTNIFQRD